MCLINIQEKIEIIKTYSIDDIEESENDINKLSNEKNKEFKIEKKPNEKIVNEQIINTLDSNISESMEKEKENNKCLNEAFNMYGTIIDMKPFVNLEEVSEMIKENIKYYKPDIDNEALKMEIMNKIREDDIKDDYIKINLDTIPEDVIKALLPLCIKGSPLFIIEMAQALIDQGYILVKDGHALELSDTFKTMMRLKDYRQIKIPIII